MMGAMSENLVGGQTCFGGTFISTISKGIVEFLPGHEANYHPTPSEAYGAMGIQKLAAVFESQPIDGGGDLISWKNMEWVNNSPGSGNLYTYIRSSGTVGGLDSTTWAGPYLNGLVDITGFNGRYMQISMVLSTDSMEGMASPSISRMVVSSYVSSGARLFFTKEFNLGFRPRHILLTYNGNIPEGAMVEFAIAGQDSVNQVNYQVITPNMVEKLDDLPYLTQNIKVMMRATGSVEIPFSIDEFSLAVSGDGQKVIT